MTRTSTVAPPRLRRSQRTAKSLGAAEEQAPPQPRKRKRKAGSLREAEEEAPPEPTRRQRKAGSLREAEDQASKAKVDLESTSSGRRTRSSRRQQLREETAGMELSEAELTEEQKQIMTEYHSMNQTSALAPSWIQKAANVHMRPRTHGGKCGRVSGMRSRRPCFKPPRGGCEQQ